MDVIDLLGPIANYSWGYILLSFSVTILGTLVHYVKKCIKLEADWNTYWSKHKPQTITAIFAVLGSYFTILYTEADPSLLTFIAVGYAIDSMFNKAPPSSKVPKRRASDAFRQDDTQ